MGFWETLAGLAGTAGGGILTAVSGPNPLSLGLIGAGAGLLKSSLVDEPREDQDKYAASETQRYQPLTHIATPAIRRANPIGDTMSGGFTGAALGQGMAKAAADKAAAEAAKLSATLGSAGVVAPAVTQAAGSLDPALLSPGMEGMAYTGGVGSPGAAGLVPGAVSPGAYDYWEKMGRNFQKYNPYA